MAYLRGITWANPRGYFPLKATSEKFKELRPDIDIRWDVRSLKDFGDFPIEVLAKNYDIILMDHPHTGISSDRGLLIPLDEWMPEGYLQQQAYNTVGKSYFSYNWNGHQWALAVDAAAQVSAYRADIMNEMGLEVPRVWDDVFQLAKELPTGFNVGMPLVPTDCVCSFISLCAQFGGNDFWDEASGMHPETVQESLALLHRLKSVVHPISLQTNPIGMLNHMSDLKSIVYVPLTFGYSHYSRLGFVSNPVTFTNIPANAEGPAGSILGGVGISISSFSKGVQAAVDYAMYVCGEDTQKGLYFDYAGQPGYRSAWLDEDVNLKSNHFFRNTLETMELSYLRPRHQGYNEFQERAGDIIYDFLIQQRSIPDVGRELIQLYLDLKRE